MRNIFFIFILFFQPLFQRGAGGKAFAQDYLGFANSAFAGVNGIDVNPANIVNNPRKWDVTIIGLNMGLANNFIGINNAGRKYVISKSETAFNQDTYTTKSSSGKPISVFLGANITLPSFMFTRPSHKDAFAFSCKTRAYANVDGLDPTIADILINGKNDSSLFNQDILSAKISLQAMVWNEYGITYGKTIMQTSNERLNVAGRLKLLQGLYSMYLFIDNADFKFYKQDSFVVTSALVHYGHSPNLEFNPSAVKFGFGGRPSLALDMGATYEFHPLTDVRSMTRSQSKTTPLQHEYKYKIGFSVQDLGWIKYLKPENARDFTAQLNGNLNFGSLQGSGTTPMANTDSELAKQFNIVADDSKYRMNLPTLMSVQGDYYAGKNVYVNSTFNYAFQFNKRESKIHEVTTFSITPRWDWKWIGAYFPFSYNKYSHVRAGFSLRLGPLIIGTADLLPLIAKKEIRGVDFHFMLKVPHIHFKNKNRISRSKSKFDVNPEKINPPKRKKDKSHMPKKDVAPQEQKESKLEEKEKKEQSATDANQEKKVRKHIFPQIHLFRKKSRHKAGGNEEKTLYFKM